LLVINVITAICGSKGLYKPKPTMYYLDAKIRSVYRSKRDMSVEKSLIMQDVHMAWKIYILPKCGRSSELYEPNLVT
jgi:hypothetical protein